MYLKIEQALGDGVERGTTTVFVDKPTRVRHTLMGALHFGDGTGRANVFVYLDDDGWRALERIMADRAFESECADRERTGALS